MDGLCFGWCEGKEKEVLEIKSGKTWEVGGLKGRVENYDFMIFVCRRGPWGEFWKQKKAAKMA